MLSTKPLELALPADSYVYREIESRPGEFKRIPLYIPEGQRVRLGRPTRCWVVDRFHLLVPFEDLVDGTKGFFNLKVDKQLATAIYNELVLT